MSSSSETKRLGREPAGRAAQVSQYNKPAKIQILHDVTSDCNGQPWPPDNNTFWGVVRRVDGCTLQMTSQRRIPPCGRGLSSSSWCEVEILQGVWTCLACNSIAPGKITVPSS